MEHNIVTVGYAQGHVYSRPTGPSTFAIPEEGDWASSTRVREQFVGIFKSHSTSWVATPPRTWIYILPLLDNIAMNLSDAADSNGSGIINAVNDGNALVTCRCG